MHCATVRCCLASIAVATSHDRKHKEPFSGRFRRYWSWLCRSLHAVSCWISHLGTSNLKIILFICPWLPTESSPVNSRSASGRQPRATYPQKILYILDWTAPIRGLDLKSFVPDDRRGVESTKYDLYAVVHKMRSETSNREVEIERRGKKYVDAVYILSAEHGNWYFIQDSLVLKAKVRQVQSCSPHALFYKKRCLGR